MTYAESQDWAEYIRRRGSLNTGRRLEYGFAMIAMMINRAQGGNKEMSYYMPHHQEPEEGEAEIEDVMRILGGGK